ncbi:hypothetical protein RND71_035064 [Anisodus tanguticus]|uniref:Integrase catalytic domain-containing protein n=1 Tax=Anisodus tanguticus TaxID=243964 RepID=A0AAE1UU56_9SOLA|nr:hypothetical protein RND71_035064 [Anisodus tanguticus]
MGVVLLLIAWLLTRSENYFKVRVRRWSKKKMSRKRLRYKLKCQLFLKKVFRKCKGSRGEQHQSLVQELRENQIGRILEAIVQPINYLPERMPIPEWNWERISMDFVVGLPKTLGKFDIFWVIVDMLIKSVHFIPVQTTYNYEKLAKIYICEIVRLHGVPISIISDQGTQFTSNFWKILQKELGTRLDLSISFHHQNDGQFERTIQV